MWPMLATPNPRRSMDARNLAELHRLQTERSGPRTAIRYKRHGLYHDLTWESYRDASLACAAALIEHGVKPGDRIGMLAENRLKWLFADMGILAAAAINVPAHAPLSAKQIRDQFNHAEVSWLFVSTAAQLQKVNQIRGELAGVRGIVVFDPVTQDHTISWLSFLMQGRHALSQKAPEIDRRIAHLRGEDLATIMYTSGTTGNSKGVMLTHHNLLSNALNMAEGCEVNAESVVLTWLPFSHIYGRLVDHYTHLAAGFTLCLAESQETLIENLAETQPTSFSAVPRFYEKALAAVASASREERRRRLRRLFGARIQWLNSGGAPLPAPIAQAYDEAGLCMLQGYGLTESSPVITFNRLENNRLGTVGQPVPGVEVRIAADGEVLTRGPHVMKGYWKDPAGTAAAIRDGWLHTGDLGQLDGEGFLTITGRKKDLLVLSNGKKVVPTEIEGLLLGNDCIDQALVYGEGKSFLTALIVPRFDRVRELVREKGVVHGDNETLVRNPIVHQLMAERIEATLAGAAAWERVHRFLLLPRPFTLEAEELTVSLKLRRSVIFQKYRDQLEKLYSEPG